MRRPGFEPGLPDWQSDVLDQTGRPSHMALLKIKLANTSKQDSEIYDPET